jgi:5-methylcytosine-specific restriction enzyme subunit McrC
MMGKLDMNLNKVIVLEEHQFFQSERKEAFENKWLVGWEYPDNAQWGYYTNFHIGAEWLDKDTPIIVVPKMESIDFLKMFLHCMFADDTDSFSEIYNIDYKGRPIKSQVLTSVLSQLIVVRFVQIIRKITRKGLLKQYVSRSENLSNVRGKINMTVNDRVNVRQARFNKVYCQYNEFTVDNPANSLLKRALLFCKMMLQTIVNIKNDSYLLAMAEVNRLLTSFNNVSDTANLSATVKTNKLYKEYEEALTLAKKILRHYDNSISNVSERYEEVPPFWIDMSLLYEHYVLSLLKEAYGKHILYQKEGEHKVRPDFLYCDNEECYILDTKYMPYLGKPGEQISVDVARQLSGYSRDNKIRKILGISNDNSLHRSVPCVVIYPFLSNQIENNSFVGKRIKDIIVEEPYYYDFYKIGVPVPSLNQS